MWFRVLDWCFWVWRCSFDSFCWWFFFSLVDNCGVLVVWFGFLRGRCGVGGCGWCWCWGYFLSSCSCCCLCLVLGYWWRLVFWLIVGCWRFRFWILWFWVWMWCCCCWFWVEVILFCCSLIGFSLCWGDWLLLFLLCEVW